MHLLQFIVLLHRDTTPPRLDFREPSPFLIRRQRGVFEGVAGKLRHFVPAHAHVQQAMLELINQACSENLRAPKCNALRSRVEMSFVNFGRKVPLL